MALSFIQRMAEEKIREAQRSGTFDNLPGKGEPLVLEDLSSVPEDLRMAYHLLKNAHVLPPEMELQKNIHSLWELLRVVEEEGQRRGLVKDIQQKVIQLDLLKRRSLSVQTVSSYTRKLRHRISTAWRKAHSVNLFLRVLRVLRGKALCHPSSLLRMTLSPVERVTTKSTKVTKFE